MENLVKQISMRIFGDEEENKAQTTRVIRDSKISSRRTRSSKRDSWKGQDWGQRQHSRAIRRGHDKTESDEYRTAIAAVAFAINSIENKKQERKILSEILETSSRPEVNGDPVGITNQPLPTIVTEEIGKKSSRETIDLTSIEKARISVADEIFDDKINQKEPADIWEKTEMEKIKQRFVKMKARIFEWEKKKKAKAKKKMIRKEGEIEWKRTRASQDFKREMDTIEKVSGGARSKNEENRKNEEIKVKKKADTIRLTGKIPKPMFFCC